MPLRVVPGADGAGVLERLRARFRRASSTGEGVLARMEQGFDVAGADIAEERRRMQVSGAWHRL